MKRLLFLSLLITAAIAFASLGAWQLERRAWKHALIDRVNARVQAKAVPAPLRSHWGNLEGYEYRRVKLSGTFRHDKAVLVDALTKLGAGKWIVTPLKTSNGMVLVNRGFVPTGTHDYERPTGRVNIEGLLRLSEPNGRFLRPNRPDADFWFSRDVNAIAKARGLQNVSPYFVDAQADTALQYPVANLTVVSFRNFHLLYALTWFGLATIALVGAWQVRSTGDGPH